MGGGGGVASLAPPETVAPVYKKGKIKSLKKDTW